MKHVPFWVEDHPRPPGLTSELPTETDYLVVGAGLTGLSTALRLSEGGKQVTVIDAGEIAGGASSVNGGMVSADVKAGVDAVEAEYGPALAAEMWASTVSSVELVRDLGKRPAIDAVVSEGGMAALGKGEQDSKKFARRLSWFRTRYDVEWELLGAGRVDRVAGGDYFDVAMFMPEAFGVQPAKLSFGLAREVKRAGAVLVDACEAKSLQSNGVGKVVETGRGAIRAGTVVIATNGYTTRRPSPGLARLLVPIGSYIIVTEPLGADVAASVFPGGAMTYTKKRLLNYMRRTHDDRILIGGRRNLHTGLDLDESAADLRRALISYWPDLERYEITHSWGGKLAVPFDLIPHIGQIDGAWYALGYAGHGVGLAVQLGHELAGMLLGEDPPSVYSRIPHTGRFYYDGAHPWFLTPASILYKTLDRVGR